MSTPFWPLLSLLGLALVITFDTPHHWEWRYAAARLGLLLAGMGLGIALVRWWDR